MDAAWSRDKQQQQHHPRSAADAAANAEETASRMQCDKREDILCSLHAKTDRCMTGLVENEYATLHVGCQLHARPKTNMLPDAAAT